MSGVVIQVENLSKIYQLGEIGTGTLSRDIERWWAKFRGKPDPFLKIGDINDRAAKDTTGFVWSLKDISFNISQGDAVGVIGRNGAGKSTLLKILSKITAPTSGKAVIHGKVASLLEVGTGFHPELTGRENIYLNGAILGMRKKSIDKNFDAIVDFAGVERYIDTPVKRYSSGMYVRLAFAVAAHLESEILIVDEVLAVGDAEFQKKCLGKMGDITRGEGRTILYVSHNMQSVQSLCNKAIVLHQGMLAYRGSSADSVAHYLRSNDGFSTDDGFSNSHKEGSLSIELLDYVLLSIDNDKIHSVASGDSFKIRFRYVIRDPNADFTNLKMSIQIKDVFGAVLYNHHNLLVNKVFSTKEVLSHDFFEISISSLPLVASVYTVGVNIFQHHDAVDVIEHAFNLEVVSSNAFGYEASPDPRHGNVLIETDWCLGK